MTRSDARMSSKAPRMAKLSCVEGKVFGARRADPRWPRPRSEVIRVVCVGACAMLDLDR